MNICRLSVPSIAHLGLPTAWESSPFRFNPEQAALGFQSSEPFAKAASYPGDVAEALKDEGKDIKDIKAQALSMKHGTLATVGPPIQVTFNTRFAKLFPQLAGEIEATV